MLSHTSLYSLANTAKWAVAQRAQESDCADRLFCDPLARAMAGPEGMQMLRLSEQANPQRENTAAYLAVRTRFFDDMIVNATNMDVRQIVIVAAGMDTRAFRLNLPGEACGSGIRSNYTAFFCAVQSR